MIWKSCVLAICLSCWTCAFVFADSFRVGDPVIVVCPLDGLSHSPYPSKLALGIIQDTGGNSHCVQMYDAVCQSGNKCGFFAQGQDWIDESRIVHAVYQGVDAQQGMLMNKGISNEAYRKCQLSCISFYLQDGN